MNTRGKGPHRQRVVEHQWRPGGCLLSEDWWRVTFRQGILPRVPLGFATACSQGTTGLRMRMRGLHLGMSVGLSRADPAVFDGPPLCLASLARGLLLTASLPPKLLAR